MGETIYVMEGILLESVRSKNYEKNIDRLMEHSDTCLICGLRIKGNIKYIQMTTDGYLINEDAEVSNSQGCFPIGPECMKKIKSLSIPNSKK